jgi:hypothetical protein
VVTIIYTYKQILAYTPSIDDLPNAIPDLPYTRKEDIMGDSEFRSRASVWNNLIGEVVYLHPRQLYYTLNPEKFSEFFLFISIINL